MAKQKYKGLDAQMWSLFEVNKEFTMSELIMASRLNAPLIRRYLQLLIDAGLVGIFNKTLDKPKSGRPTLVYRRLVALPFDDNTDEGLSDTLF